MKPSSPIRACLESTLIVGLGSMHGDDSAGWLAAKALSQRLSDPRAQAPRAQVRVAQSPLDILHWIDSLHTCIICDASRGAGEVGAVRRWQWPCSELANLRWSGTHDISLPQALQLAQQLGRLPPQVVLWSVEVDPSHQRLNTDGDCRFSAAMERALPHLIESVLREHFSIED